MDAKKTNLDALLPATVHLNNLLPGKNKQHIIVRVLRMWEARHFKLNGTLMSLDLLLLDEKDTLIQGSIYHRRIHRFKDLLKEGNIYQLSDFEVVSTYSHYKVMDNPFTIRFTDTTKIMEVAEGICSIKLEKFRLHTYAEFQQFAGTNLHLLDVVGQVIEVQGSKLDDATCNQKIVLVLLLQDNSTVRVTLWDAQASDFRQQFHKTGRDCAVIVCTCLNPKMFAGKLHLNSSGSTKIYINYNLQVVKEFIKRMGIEDTPTANIVEEDTGKLITEIWSIEQILEYISSGANQEKEVICRGKIIDIGTRNGWKYLSCASCSKKLGRSTTSLICNTCNKSTTIGVAKFRVELTVECGDRTTTFVLFDRDAKKITHTTAEDITASEEKGENCSNHQSTPNCLLEMIGKTMDFQVKISEYNFQASVQTFTVTRIATEMLPLQSPITAATETNDGKEVKIKTEDAKTLPTFRSASTVGEVANPEDLEPEDADPKKRRLI